ncbi:MAG TPA: AGE family epimerase/isomerase [Solirubrobacteraceae bacterium]|nr:AGE family epimerase/isomerase [Solirubrobacteraceae bacterium]
MTKEMTTMDMAAVTSGGDSWLESPQHKAWATEQALRLLSFFTASVDSNGWFVELDDYGRPLPTGCPPATGPRQNLLTVTRAVHSYALGEMLGIPGCRSVVDRGLTAVWSQHRDAVAGGYIEAVGRGGAGDTTKAAYGHAHVLLAAASALAAGHADASAIFDDALAVIDERFWSEADGAASTEAYDREWQPLEPYRGANSNMHLCESLLAAAEVGERPDLAERAARLASRFIDGQARAHGWLLPEHYDTSWQPMLDYNRDHLDDPFRPYGATIGHSLEWSRLVICARVATGRSEEWFLEASEAMFERAVSVGWDGSHGGLAYTVDWDGAPANPDHYWWPVAEGIATSSYLLRITGRDLYESWYRTFWEYAATYLIDRERGGWHPELDRENRRKVHPWYGKPDIYHSLQACLLPLLPVASSAVGAVRRLAGAAPD